MTLPIETYERIWRETNAECGDDGYRSELRWNKIYDRKVSEELAKVNVNR